MSACWSLNIHYDDFDELHFYPEGAKWNADDASVCISYNISDGNFRADLVVNPSRYPFDNGLPVLTHHSQHKHVVYISC